MVKDEIQNAIQELGLNEAEFNPLGDEAGGCVLKAVVSHFVTSGDRRWWWEDFRFPSTGVRFTDQRGFERLVKIVPDGMAKVWFIAEDSRPPFFTVYEATPETIQAVIGQCYFFEYYLVAQDFSWLLCENHHGNLIAIGKELENRLQQLNIDRR